jgi:hypothetical protein
MVLLSWYLAVLYKDGVRVAWVRNAQDIDDAADTSPALGGDYYASLSSSRTVRIRFVTRAGDVDSRDIPPGTPETFARLPAQ